MYRRISKLKTTGQKIGVAVLPINKGGTGAKTAKEAAVNLGLITYAESNKPNRAVVLPANGKIDPSLFEAGAGSKQHALDGPKTITAGAPANYTILDLDDFLEYEISADGADVQRNGDMLTVVAYQGVSSVKLRINTKEYIIAVDGASGTIATPSIVSPVNNFDSASEVQTVVSSGFGSSIPGESHLSSTWELASDANFTQIILSLTKSTVSKTSWVVTGLVAGRSYFVRVRHHGLSGATSNWSPAVVFSTKASFVVSKLVQTIQPPTHNVNGSVLQSQNIGTSVALSKDGNHMVVGTFPKPSPVSNLNNVTMVAFYSKVGGSWVQNTAFSDFPTLDPSAMPTFDASVRAYEMSVAISGDGMTAAVANHLVGNREVRQVRIYRRNGNAWVGVQSVGSDGLNERYATSLAFSYDGSVLVVGSPRANTNGVTTGAVYVYRTGVNVRDGFLYSPTNADQILMPTGLSSADNALYGMSVDVSSDGRFLAVGAPGAKNNNDIGRVYLYALSGSRFEPAPIWTSNAYPFNNAQVTRGHRVKLNADGTMLGIGVQISDGVTAVTQTSIGGVQMFSITAANGGYGVQFITALQPGDLIQGCGMNFDMDDAGSQVFVASPYYSTGNHAKRGNVIQYARQGNGGYFIQGDLVEKLGSWTANDMSGTGMAVSGDGTVFALGTPMLATATTSVNYSTPTLLSIGGAVPYTAPQQVTRDTLEIDITLAVPTYTMKPGPLTIPVTTNIGTPPLYMPTQVFPAGQLNPAASNYGFPTSCGLQINNGNYLDVSLIWTNRRVNPAGGYFYDAQYGIGGSGFLVVVTYNSIDHMTAQNTVKLSRATIDNSQTDGQKIIRFQAANGDFPTQYTFTRTTSYSSAADGRGAIHMFQ